MKDTATTESNTHSRPDAHPISKRQSTNTEPEDTARKYEQKGARQNKTVKQRPNTPSRDLKNKTKRESQNTEPKDTTNSLEMTKPHYNRAITDS